MLSLNNSRNLAGFLFVFILSVFLAGCGGGSSPENSENTDTDADPPPPADKVISVTARSGPIAAYRVGEMVVLDASKSSTSSSEPLSYAWSFS